MSNPESIVSHQYISSENAPEKKKGRGCFFYGCLTTILVTCLLGVAGFFLGKSALNNLVQAYTETQPMLLPKLEVSQEERNQILSKFDEFSKSLEEGGKTKSIELDARDINVLFDSSPNWNQFGGEMRVEINDGIHARLSIPLDQIGYPGRYFNGEGKFKLHLSDGTLQVFLEKLAVNRVPIPDAALSQLNQQNLAEAINRDPKAAKALKRIESLDIENGKIKITAAESLELG